MHVNKLIFSGRLTRDPEMRKTGEGFPVLNVTLAQNTRVRKGEDWVEGEPIFLDVVFWGKRAESFVKYHAKGDMAMVEGKLRLDTWEDPKEPGRKRTKHKLDADEWHFVPRVDRPEGGGGPAPRSAAGGSRGDDTPF